jgi:hypothetical protein
VPAEQSVACTNGDVDGLATVEHVLEKPRSANRNPLVVTVGRKRGVVSPLIPAKRLAVSVFGPASPLFAMKIT